MIAVLFAFGLSLLVMFSPGTTLFLGAAVTLTSVYLFAANIPLTLFGIDEIIRYSKEPLILMVFFRFAFEVWNLRLRRQTASTGAPAIAQARMAWTNAGKFAFALLIAWSGITLVQAGIAGLLGYVRGVLFPVALLLYLTTISDTTVQRVGDAVAISAVVFIALLFACALIHLYVDAQFLIPESFRNRLDYDLPYRSVVEYGTIRRYQSFFGDPNRAAIVCLIALWIASIGRLRPWRWIIFAMVAPLLWFTQSRTGMLVMALWGLYLVLRPNPARDLPAVLIIASIFVVMAVATWLFFSNRAGSVEEVSRAIIWFGIAQHVISSPFIFFFGEGFGWVGQVGGTFNVSDAVQLTSSSGRTLALTVVDNSYLTLLSSLGIVGTLTVVVFYRDVLRSMAARMHDRRLRRQFWMMVSLMGVWSFFFDALVSFPWTFLFPLVLRYANVSRSSESHKKPTSSIWGLEVATAMKERR